GSEVLAVAGDFESKRVPVELQALLRVGHHDGRMVYPKKQLVRGLMPFWRAFVRRKLQNLERVTVRVFEVERSDSGRRLDRLGKRLWTCRRVLNLVLSQPIVGAIHISGDDRDVLKPAIVASRIDWYGSTLRCEVFGELDEFIAELHSRN